MSKFAYPLTGVVERETECRISDFGLIATIEHCRGRSWMVSTTERMGYYGVTHPVVIVHVDHAGIDSYQTRRKIERQLRQLFVDEAKSVDRLGWID